MFRAPSRRPLFCVWKAVDQAVGPSPDQDVTLLLQHISINCNNLNQLIYIICYLCNYFYWVCNLYNLLVKLLSEVAAPLTAECLVCSIYPIIIRISMQRAIYKVLKLCASKLKINSEQLINNFTTWKEC